MTNRIEIPGVLFEARASRHSKCMLVLDGGRLDVKGPGGTIASNLKVASVQGSKDIYFKCGLYFRSDSEFPQELVRSVTGRAKRFTLWLEAPSAARMLVMVGLLAAFAITVRAATESIGTVVAVVFPKHWEQAIGQETYRTAETLFFEESRIPVQDQRRLQSSAQDMALSASLASNPDIIFHRSDWFGANAIAFAGGPVVVTDSLVEHLDEEEVLAVIAHEFVHVEERHSLKQMAEILGALAIAAIYFSADETLVDALAAIAVNNLGMQSSRMFERQADLGALDVLAADGRDQEKLVSALEKLALQACADESADLQQCIEEDGMSWFSTHPSWPERLEYLTGRIEGRI